MPGEKRRKWCDQPKNLAGLKFTPEHTVTLHIWQHVIDFSNYKLNLGGVLNVDIAPSLCSQPLQLTVKNIKVSNVLSD